jgi:hypothetical protein
MSAGFTTAVPVNSLPVQRFPLPLSSAGPTECPDQLDKYPVGLAPWGLPVIALTRLVVMSRSKDFDDDQGDDEGHQRPTARGLNVSTNGRQLNTTASADSRTTASTNRTKALRSHAGPSVAYRWIPTQSHSLSGRLSLGSNFVFRLPVPG